MNKVRKKQKKKMSNKGKLVIFSISGFSVSIIPLFVAVISNIPKYVHTPFDGYRLTFGGIIVCVLIACAAIGRVKWLKKRVILYGIAALLCFVLSKAIEDAAFLFLMAFIGELADMIFFAPKREKYIKLIEKDGQIETTEETAEKIIAKFIVENNKR